MPSAFFIDSMGLVFRAYHAMARSGFRAPDGEPTGAVFGFANMITTLLDREKPDFIAAVFDTSAPTFRHERFEQYKANRTEFPEELIPQMPRIKEFLDSIGIPRIEMPGFEADDIIGTLALQAASRGFEVRCLTSDKDYFQLVGDHVHILRPGKDSGEYDIYGRNEVYAKMGVWPEQIIDLLALIGDSSDNVPGVKGIGEKTAVPLILEYGSVQHLYQNLDRVAKDSVRTKLEAGRDMAFLSRELVTIHTSVPLPADTGLEFCRPRQPDAARVDALLAMLNFSTLRRKWAMKSQQSAQPGVQQDSALSNQQESAGDSLQTQDFSTMPVLKTLKDREHDYILVKDPTALKLMLHELKAGPALCFDLETTSLDTMNCSIVGFALCTKPGKAFFVLTRDKDMMPGAEYAEDSLFGNTSSAAENAAHPHEISLLTAADVAVALKPLLENPKLPKIAQNGKFDALILRRYGVNVHPLAFDTMLASYVINPDQQHGMDAQARRLLGYDPIPITSLIGEKKKGSMRDANPYEIKDYACEDADITLSLAQILKPEIEKENLQKVALDIEMPVSEVLVEMEFNGVAIDTQALGTISQHIKSAVNELREKIYYETGAEFNIDSPRQVGEILFEKMQLPAPKKTKTGYSTDIGVLSELADSYPVAGMILEHRQLQKLQSTYVEALPRMVNPSTGRIHTTYNQTVAGTGRLSSTEPNLQNIPVRNPLGRSIRRAFVPAPGNILLSADYSQVELRVMAAVSGDETLISAFQNGYDIHAATAAALFGVELDMVQSEHRRIAKTVNFGIMYGQGSFGLARQLGIGRSEAKAIIDQYFERYPRIRAYIDSTIEQARTKGYVETLTGRRRYFPDVNSRNQNIRQSAERAAVNMPIQGTAADMMKLAMISIHKDMKKHKFSSMMILQIHDELVFDVLPGELDDLTQLVKRNMEHAMLLQSVPLIAETGTGSNWDEAH
jgi:DNA polymerase-1